MGFRGIALVSLWTFLIGPVVHQPGASLVAQPDRATESIKTHPESFCAKSAVSSAVTTPHSMHLTHSFRRK
jgi:hypothetical protein